MDRQHHQRALDLFAATYELSEEARRELLDRECGDDTGIREEVESLLARDTEDKGFLEGPALGSELARVAGAVMATDGRHEKPGTVIGRYKLLQEIGEGGFGSVYMAEQTEPVQRKVALKVIKLGMDTKQVIARFEAERQALAMMDHPNVAKVLDAGATETGRPYFVMELVKGVPITEYCDTHELSTTERLELFIDVCHSVQHAHQKGVIHRDIKPSNVLVTLHDGRPVSKIIDFGIAKATNARLTEKTMFTEFRQLIGTPAYMSPEQAEMSGLDVDTRSDIYALGVLLYELLTGTTPFDSERLRSASYEELQRIIREEEPDKPSTRLSSLVAVSGNGASKERIPSIEVIARHRRDDPAHLARSLRGDLDWVAMKCLEKDRSRRYETANGLAADIQRHLENQPVEAGPPTAAYRVRKFVRRNRVMVTAATVVVAALLAGTAGTTFGLLRAEQRQKQTQQVSDFQAAMLSEIDVEAMGRGIKERYREEVQAALKRQHVGEFPGRRKRTPEEIEFELAAFDQRADAAQAVDVARQVMDEYVLAQAADALETEFADQPLVRAQLHNAIGDAYRELGIYDAAEPHLRAALETCRRVLGDDHPDTLRSIKAMGGLLRVKGEYDAAEEFSREALDGLRRVLGNDDPDTLKSINNLGLLLQEQDKLPEAELLIDEALQGQRRVLGDDHPDTLASINNMGRLLQAQGKPAEAEPYYREALEGSRRVLGDDHRNTLILIDNLGYALKAQWKLTEAEPYYREALEGRRRVLGDDHRETLISVNNLGALLMARGRLAKAERYFREALEGSRRVLGDDHPHTLISIKNMGLLLRRQGKLPDAESYLQEAVERCRRVLGIEHSATLSSIYNMGRLLEEQGRLAEAEAHFREVLESGRRVLGDEHPIILNTITSMGTVFQVQGKLDEAQSLFADATRAARSGLGDHPITANIESHHADVLWELGRVDEAIDLAHTALDRYLAHQDWLPGKAACARRVLTAALRAAGREAEALAVRRELIQAKRQRPGTTPGALASALAGYASEAIAIGDTASLQSAEGALRECLEIREAILPDDHRRVWRRYNTMSLLGDTLVRQASEPSLAVETQIDKLREAEPLLVESGDWLTRNAESIPQRYRAERLRQALERIVKLYEFWNTVEPDNGKAEQAAEWRAELDNLPGP